MLLLSCTHSKDKESASEESGKLLGDYPVGTEVALAVGASAQRRGAGLEEQVHFCTCESASYHEPLMQLEKNEIISKKKSIPWII